HPAEGNVLDTRGWIGSFTEDGVFNNVTGEASYRGEHLGDLVSGFAKMFPDIHRELHRVNVMGDVVAVELSILRRLRRLGRSKKIAVELPWRGPPPTLAPVPAHLERHAPVAPAVAIRVAPTDGNAAVLGIFLEVLSMQLTSQLQMGAIRARPSSLIASLRLQSATTLSAIPSELGFQLGPARLNGHGRISTLRLIPTTKPLQPAQTRTAFEIGGVALIPNDTRARVQLTPAGTTPMTMELFAHLELDAVELSANFQVAQLILNWNTDA